MNSLKNATIRLGEIRRTKKIAFKELSRRTGLSKVCLCNIENLKTAPKFDTLNKIATALEAEIEILIKDK